MISDCMQNTKTLYAKYKDLHYPFSPNKVKITKHVQYHQKKAPGQR